MSSRQLLKAIGEIDDRFIDEAAEVSTAAKTAARRIRRRRWIAAAACLIVAAGIGVMSLPQIFTGANKASAENASASRPSNYSLDGYRPDSITPDKAAESRDLMAEDTQITAGQSFENQFSNYGENQNASVRPSGTEAVVIDVMFPDDMNFTDAARVLWLKTVTGR